MNVILFLQVVSSILLVLFAFTQVVLPLFRGTKAFPMFRKEGALLDELAEARQATDQRSIMKEIERERAEQRDT